MCNLTYYECRHVVDFQYYIFNDGSAIVALFGFSFFFFSGFLPCSFPHSIARSQFPLIVLLWIFQKQLDLTKAPHETAVNTVLAMNLSPAGCFPMHF